MAFLDIHFNKISVNKAMAEGMFYPDRFATIRLGAVDVLIMSEVEAPRA